MTKRNDDETIDQKNTLACQIHDFALEVGKSYTAQPTVEF